MMPLRSGAHGHSELPTIALRSCLTSGGRRLLKMSESALLLNSNESKPTERELRELRATAQLAVQ